MGHHIDYASILLLKIALYVGLCVGGRYAIIETNTKVGVATSRAVVTIHAATALYSKIIGVTQAYSDFLIGRQYCGIALVLYNSTVYL